MEVTTTSTKAGKFDSRFFHLIYEEEFARLKGHFGPINSLAFHPATVVAKYNDESYDDVQQVHAFAWVVLSVGVQMKLTN